MCFTASFRPQTAVDGLDNGVLLLRRNANAVQRLPCAAVRADEGLVVQPGKRRRFVLGLAAAWAD